MCFHDNRLSEPHNPWIGVGPDRSRALTFSTADNKGLQAGVVESNGAVRSFHWEHCAMGQLLRAAGVPCDMTLSEGGRNTVTHNCKQYALNLAAMMRCTKWLGSAPTGHLHTSWVEL
ncbi:hypothetical protein WJX72_011622 [[Myrmecia] bisecta]|uniref:Uncharacterized protein n=1 Tax=[Myrmecia] bisecta TaxID=41462 RepID=A0AAW1PLB7_9CHLO